MTETGGKRPEPYVGISGIISAEQQWQVESLANQAMLDRNLLLGVKAAHKTQFLDVDNKYGPDWYPVGPEQFELAATRQGRRLGTMAIAQAYFDVEYVGNPGYRELFAKRIFERGAGWIDGIQFDMLPWQTGTEMLDFLAGLKEKYGTAILLQCHGDAMRELRPEEVVHKLEPYAPVLDYVLFDASHGRGEPMNTRRLKQYLTEAYASDDLETVGFAIAGGLDGESVRRDLPALVWTFPDISWDAEGRLHPGEPGKPRPLDMEVVQDYLQASSNILI
jgi:hypothetical protein